MRRRVTPERLNEFMKELASLARGPGKVYFTGGATALLLGFREQTIDIDIRLDPEPEGVFEALATLKNRLDINIELASPMDFIPAGPDWRERSQLIARIGPLEFFHFDLSLQALAKLERGHTQDLKDVESMLRSGAIDAAGVRKRFDQIQPDLLRYPAIDPGEFRRKAYGFLDQWQKQAKP